MKNPFLKASVLVGVVSWSLISAVGSASPLVIAPDFSNVPDSYIKMCRQISEFHINSEKYGWTVSHDPPCNAQCKKSLATLKVGVKKLVKSMVAASDEMEMPEMSDIKTVEKIFDGGTFGGCCIRVPSLFHEREDGQCISGKPQAKSPILKGESL